MPDNNVFLIAYHVTYNALVVLKCCNGATLSFELSTTPLSTQQTYAIRKSMQSHRRTIIFFFEITCFYPKRVFHAAAEESD
jgi:hypothetical protein